MLPTDDRESEDPILVVENVKSLGTGAGRKTGDDSDLPDGSDADVFVFDSTTTDEVFVDLRKFEAADDGPDGVRSGGCALG